MFGLLKKNVVYMLKNWKAVICLMFLLYVSMQGTELFMKLPRLSGGYSFWFPIILGLEMLRLTIEFGIIQYLSGHKVNPFSAPQRMAAYLGVEVLLVYLPLGAMFGVEWLSRRIQFGQIVPQLWMLYLINFVLIAYFVYMICFSLRLCIWEVQIVNGKNGGFRTMWRQTKERFGWWTLAGIILVLPQLLIGMFVELSGGWPWLLAGYLLSVWSFVFGVSYYKRMQK